MNNQTNYVEGNVTYKFSLAAKKWEFTHPTPNGQTATILVPGKGTERAHKIARIINGSLKRTNKDGFGKLDNLGRANIKAIIGL